MSFYEDWVEKQDYTFLVQEDVMRELRNFDLLDRFDDINEMLQMKVAEKLF
ncbi:conserved protein of unknown function [Paenibacillus alvei]|uniref:Uncharacterized protein n=1 Tax=Paenibacillus alvei TaxID=44250 RepID=A0A383RKT4_PAEAL|nr:conserved protein of unknown function [Paenibacillus alvei]